MNKRILVISDLHFPFAHKDWHGFLTKLKAKYKPDTIVNIGDEMDFHSINVSHTIDPDLPSPKDELELGKKEIHRITQTIPTNDFIRIKSWFYGFKTCYGKRND
jgi:predicted phosphodiesterase